LADRLLISVLTFAGSEYGLRLLNQLRAEQIPVHQIVVLDAVWRTRGVWLRRWIRQLGLCDALLFAAWGYTSRIRDRAVLERRQPIDREYRRLADRVDFASFPRSPETLAALRSGAPDLLLLADSGIVPRSVLAIPRHATLNAHPGILPHYRGLDPELWAIQDGRFEAIGCTLHIVDPGIDTGPILKIEPYSWQWDENLELLILRLRDGCIRLLVQACLLPWPASRERATPQTAGKHHGLMTLRQRWSVERKLRVFVQARAMR
jgi:folate-dependent phosphoribosylglycinamide formyltransferase PurN